MLLFLPAATSASGGGDLAENTLYSSTDLFLLYKQLLKQTLQLTRGRGLLGLVGLLKKYLREYTEKVLLPGIPGLTSSSSSSGGGLAKPFSLSGLASLGMWNTLLMKNLISLQICFAIFEYVHKVLSEEPG